MATPQQRRVSEHVRQRTREWFRKAEHELAFLEIAPLDLSDPPTDTPCKMAHMVAEYSLKAYLMLNKRKIDKSHDLVEILNDCIAAYSDPDFEKLRADCQWLTEYRLDSVYPGPMVESISIEEARIAIGAARTIKSFVLEKVKELGYYQ